MRMLSWFMNVVRVARLLLRHSVSCRDRLSMPACIVRLFKELDLEEFHEVVWHELFFLGAVDGLIQGFDSSGQRQFLAWVYMGEIFRLVHYYPQAEEVRRYEVHLTPYIWEPLCAEQEIAHRLEQQLQLDTSLGECVSKSCVVRRSLHENRNVVEMRESRSRKRDDDDIQCSTEKRLYSWSCNGFVLERRKWWEGDKDRQPRQEHEEWYDIHGAVYKRIERAVSELGDATEKTYIGDDSHFSINQVQRYSESGIGNTNFSGRRLRQRRAPQQQESVLYIIPDAAS